eukprot:1643555-Alexandrium_andersonii.AAC.1
MKRYPGDPNALMLWLRQNVAREVADAMRQPGTAAKQTARQAMYANLVEAGGAAVAAEEATP